MKINVVCVLRQGGKVGYDASWVRKLQDAVSRNLTLPHKFICLSDCEVSCERIPLDTEGDGFWAKMQLFKPVQFEGPVLYIDLDTVICSNIDDIILKVANENFVMWYESDREVHSSAMMWWNNDCSYLWDLYLSKSLDYWKSVYGAMPLYGDQALISENTDHKLFTELVPNDWFHIAGRKDDLLDLSKVKILHFRKTHTKPSTLPNHPLVKKHWI
jgi:alpha-N-acetylglucosamine transferase